MIIALPPLVPDIQVCIEGETMANRYKIKYLENSSLLQKRSPEDLKSFFEDALEAVNQQMSVFRPDSQISLFNQHHDASLFPIADEFAKVVLSAQALHQQTEGGLDISLALAVNLWGFGYAQPDATAFARERLNSKIGMDKFVLEKLEQGFALKKLHPDVCIDVSAIAKGFAVDWLAQILDEAGITNYLVDIGGEMRARGKNMQGDFWKIAIEHPTGDTSLPTHILLQDACIATSGNYRHCRREENGRLVHHLIHPRSLAPTEGSLLSLSVVGKEAMWADGMATGLFTLGAKRAMEIAERDALAVCLFERVDAQVVRWMSRAFQALCVGV